MAIIQLENITHTYGNKKVLENLNLQIAGKKITCLLGSTGSGKTTVLRLIAGLEEPDDGRIIIDNKLVTNGHKILILPAQRKIGFVFQDLSLWPHFTVFNNVAWCLRVQGDKEADLKAEKLLDEMGLAEHIKKYPHQLSGGQQQLLAIARALGPSPEILLMDEPLSNLDTKIKLQMLGRIKELKDRFQITIVYVTHDHNEAKSIADDIISLS